MQSTLSRWRNKLFASEAFQRLAVRLPFARKASNTYARRLFDLAVGFSYARVLHACVELDIFARLRDGPKNLQALAEACALPVKGMEVLLRAAAALDLVEPHGRLAFRLGPLGAALLGNPGVEEMIAHHSLLYRDLVDPVALLRGGPAQREVQRFWPYGEDADPVQAAAYSRLMDRTQAMIARLVLNAYPIHRHRLLMDVGGGEGAFLIAAARRAAHLRLRLVDLAPVAARAAVRFGEAGLGARAEAIALDARGARLPPDADVVSLVRVLHDHDDDDAMALLRASHAALAPGGVLLIAEPMSKTRGAHALGAYFTLYLAAMGQGRPRTASMLASMAKAAGFVAVGERKTAQPVLVRLLVARKGV